MIIKSLELKILVIIAIIYTIALSQAVLFPILFAFFLYLIFTPMMEWLIFLKIPRIIASGIITILLLGIIALGIAFLTQPALSWIENAPENFRIIENKFRFIKTSLNEIDTVAAKAQEITDTNKKQTIEITTPTPSLAPSLLSSTSNIITTFGIILILLYFYLLYFKSFIQKVDKIILRKRSAAYENQFILSLQNAVSLYIFTFSLISMAFGAVMTVVFWLLNVPNAVLWGAMVMVLTFFPYIGHLTGIIIIFCVSVITFNQYYNILMPPVLYFLLAVLEGQVISPIFLGTRLNLNPILIFLNIFFWSWIWGVPGALISMPLLLIIKITLEHVPFFSKYTLLLEK
jgi:predicted PurR-regulated permease PerM